MDLLGVGLQLNPTTLPLLDEHPELGRSFDFGELLCDIFIGPIDSGYVIDPGYRKRFDKLKAQYKLVAHSNYGEDFGFKPVDETVCVQRHVPIAREMGSPWLTNHLFYGPPSSSQMWSSPLQFSKPEVDRVAERARAIQERAGMPLLHENAFYYAPMPDSDLAEAEFIARMVEKSGTWLMLDLHNIYANSVNFEGYDPWQFLRTIPLDRVMEIHLAGGQYLEDWYHDLHNHLAPDAVWEMLDWVIPRAPALRGVVLEVQGPGHTPMSRPVDNEWIPMIERDLARAKAAWNKVHAAG